MVKFGEHFSAWITLEKEVEPLIEYDVSSIADQAGMKCWIPSVEGAVSVLMASCFAGLLVDQCT
jgi:hypothetical protein